MREARLDDFGSGLAPVTDGWFVVNVEDRPIRAPARKRWPPLVPAPRLLKLGSHLEQARIAPVGKRHRLVTQHPPGARATPSARLLSQAH